ncbi:MAG: hypothetical protein ACLPYZ_16615 [Limisphaerales bacterium]
MAKKAAGQQMSLFCSKTDLVTESDVEQKLIYPLLSSTQGLGYFAEEIKTKSYLAPTDLDKGAGRKVGYYPDYAVILSSLPALIVEAKAPSESVEQGFKEAQLYAHEINKRFHNLPDNERESRLADDLAKWIDDPKHLVKGVLRYFGGDCGNRLHRVKD